MTKIELAFQKELSKVKINMHDCKECNYFTLDTTKLVCNFKGNKIEDCRLATINLFK